MVLTFNISSLLHSSWIKPSQRYAHNRSESTACVYEIQDLLLFIPREDKVGFINSCTLTCTDAPPSARAVNKQTVALAVLYLIYRTFVALDIYRGSGAVNFMQTPSKHSMPRAWGLLSRRHHKSFHAKINHFHWTSSTGDEMDGGGGVRWGE